MERQARQQRRRLQMTLLSVANTLVQALVIVLFARAGEVGWGIAVAFMLFGAG